MWVTALAIALTVPIVAQAQWYRGNLQDTLRWLENNSDRFAKSLSGSGDGEAIADNAREVTDWSGQLPSDGSYVVRVYLVRAEARRNKRPVSFNVRLDIN